MYSLGGWIKPKVEKSNICFAKNPKKLNLYLIIMGNNAKDDFWVEILHSKL